MEKLTEDEIYKIMQRLPEEAEQYKYSARPLTEDEKHRIARHLAEGLAEYGHSTQPHLICMPGDKIWAITSNADYTSGSYAENPLKHPQQKKVASITLSKEAVLYHVKGRSYGSHDFGRTVFLSEKDAKMAIRAQNGKENEAVYAEVRESYEYE